MRAIPVLVYTIFTSRVNHIVRPMNGMEVMYGSGSITEVRSSTGSLIRLAGSSAEINCSLIATVFFIITALIKRRSILTIGKKAIF